MNDFAQGNCGHGNVAILEKRGNLSSVCVNCEHTDKINITIKNLYYY